MEKFLYSFRTFPYKDQLRTIDKDLFIFGILKRDFEVLAEIIEKQNPKYIIGIALSNTNSRIESIAVNHFSESKVIQKEGLDKIKLFVPETDLIMVSNKPTTSFCNWTMYKIATFLKIHNLESKLLFVHINIKDLYKLKALINSL